MSFLQKKGLSVPTSAEVLLVDREPCSTAPRPGHPRVAWIHLRLLVALNAGGRRDGGDGRDGRSRRDGRSGWDGRDFRNVWGGVQLLAVRADVDDGAPGEAEVSAKVVDALHPSFAGVLPEGALVDV